MKRFIFASLLLFFNSVVFAQATFDLGLKAGVHTTNLTIDEGQLFNTFDVGISSNSITKMHIGAFGRLGYGRLFIQPEAYFSQKGGDLSSGLIEETGSFDYENIDVPVLLGYHFVKGKVFDIRGMVGPVFSFVLNADYPDELNSILNEEFFEDNILGIQYGLGIDVLFLTLDARVEHASNIYDDPELVSGKSTTFMFSIGFKIL